MTERVKVYLDEMRTAAKMNLANPDSIYSSIEGHKRFFRESGFALKDFTKAEQGEILKSFYGMVYVTGCNLKPLLDAKEMQDIMRSQIKHINVEPKSIQRQCI